MRAFIAVVRQKWIWVCQNKPFWAHLTLIAFTIVFLDLIEPTRVNGVPSDFLARFWGMWLQLLGAATVWIDLTKTARDFGEGPSLRKTWEWIKAGFRKPLPINGSVNITLQGAYCIATGSVATIHEGTPSNEVRIARLEHAVKSLEGDLQEVHTTVATHKSELTNDLKARAAELRQSIGEVDKRLKESLVGGFSVLSFGVVWLVVGIVLTSIPAEITNLIHLGQLPKWR